MRGARFVVPGGLVVGVMRSTAALAFITAAGTGSGTMTVATMSPPTAVTAGATGTAVTVSWSPAGAPLAVDGYYIRRGASAACGTSAAALVTALTCQDTGVPAGAHTYSVTAVFRSWSATSAPSAPVTVAAGDTVPPTVSSIARAAASPTAAASVAWTVTFSEAVTGVGTSDFAVVHSGLGAGPAITAVTGGPTVYTVTASTGTGSGTLGLNLVDDDSITDGPNTLAGAADGSFTGPSYAIDRTDPVVSSMTTGSATAVIGIAGRTTAISSSPSGAAATSLTIAKPAGVAAGDLLLAQVSFEKGTAAGTDAAITPAGWALVRRDDRGADLGQGVFRKVATAADVTATSYTWSFAQAVKSAGAIAWYKGVSPSSPIVAAGGATGDTGALVAPEVTTTASSRLLALFGVKKTTTLSTPAGMSAQTGAQNPQDVTLLAADEARGSAGATGARTSTAGVVDKWVAQQVALRAGSAPVKTASVSWTVTFSESVSGVGAADFTLTTSGLGGTPAITGVTGTGAVYTVTASTGSGSGTLALALVDDGSIADAAGNTLAGAADGGFAGDVATIDRSAPSAADIQATSGGSAGEVSPGDVVTYTFSEPMAPGSIKTGWDGTATTVTAVFTDTGDTLTVTGTNLGSLALGGNYFKSNQTGEATMVMDGSTVRLTITSRSGGTGQYNPIATSTMVWTPSTAATDAAGNAMSGTARTQTGAPKQNF